MILVNSKVVRRTTGHFRQHPTGTTMERVPLFWASLQRLFKIQSLELWTVKNHARLLSIFTGSYCYTLKRASIQPPHLCEHWIARVNHRRNSRACHKLSCLTWLSSLITKACEFFRIPKCVPTVPIHRLYTMELNSLTMAPTASVMQNTVRGIGQWLQIKQSQTRLRYLQQASSLRENYPLALISQKSCSGFWKCPTLERISRETHLQARRSHLKKEPWTPRVVLSSRDRFEERRVSLDQGSLCLDALKAVPNENSRNLS